MKKTAAQHIAAVIRDPSSRRYAIEKLDQGLQAAEQRTWGQLLKFLPPDDAAEWLSSGMQNENVRTWIAEGTRKALIALLDRPIGRPADWLQERTTERLSDHLSPAIWNWTQRQVPVVVERVDVQTMVEEKIMGFSLRRVEEIVRNTTQRELRLIVRFGYILGAGVGAIAYCISLLF